MTIVSLLKLYPKRIAFFIGAAIGLLTHTISSNLCASAEGGCSRPYYLALFIGAALVGLYAGLFVRGFWKLVTIASITFLTYLAMNSGNLRTLFPGDLFSYIMSYGVITLVYVVAIDLLNQQRN